MEDWHRRCHVNALTAFGALAFFLSPTGSLAEMRYRLTSDIAERYDSNIYLSSGHEKSDFITTPSIAGEMADESATRTLSARYVLGYNKFARYSENDYVSHSGELSWDQALSERISWHITDRGYRSEEPAEEDPEITTTRDSRGAYIRNSLETGFSYRFGPEDLVTLSYGDLRLWNDSPEEEDINSYGPHATLDYWLTNRHGMTLNLSSDRREYEETPSNTSNIFGLVYHLRKTTQTILHLGYTHEDYCTEDPADDDYAVHDFTVGLDHAWSSAWTFGASIGYYRAEPEDGASDDGYSYVLSLVRRFSRGSFTISGDGGHRGEYTEPERTGTEQRGFTKYQSISAALLYDLAQPLSLHATLSYDHEKTEGGGSITDETWSAGTGFSYRIRPWLSGGVDLMYENRDSTEPDDEYEDFSAILRLSAFKDWR